jgi:hypothetical protein
MPKIIIVDNQEEHNKILFELGLLDDEEDWDLYQKQEKIFDDIDEESYIKYTRM